jgi:hypothetical protein
MHKSLFGGVAGTRKVQAYGVIDAAGKNGMACSRDVETGTGAAVHIGRMFLRSRSSPRGLSVPSTRR